jgi:acetyl-CoA carboxylase carboxyltransferase component
MSDDDRDAFEAPIIDTYEREGSPWYSTARLWDDGVIDPRDTRKLLALGLAPPPAAGPLESTPGTLAIPPVCERGAHPA